MKLALVISSFFSEKIIFYIEYLSNRPFYTIGTFLLLLVAGRVVRRSYRLSRSIREFANPTLMRSVERSVKLHSTPSKEYEKLLMSLTEGMDSSEISEELYKKLRIIRESVEKGDLILKDYEKQEQLENFKKALNKYSEVIEKAKDEANKVNEEGGGGGA